MNWQSFVEALDQDDLESLAGWIHVRMSNSAPDPATTPAVPLHQTWALTQSEMQLIEQFVRNLKYGGQTSGYIEAIKEVRQRGYGNAGPVMLLADAKTLVDRYRDFLQDLQNKGGRW